MGPTYTYSQLARRGEKREATIPSGLSGLLSEGKGKLGGNYANGREAKCRFNEGCKKKKSVLILIRHQGREEERDGTATAGNETSKSRDLTSVLIVSGGFLESGNG